MRPWQVVRDPAGIRHLVHDDQMMLRIDSDLHVIADDARARPLVAIERESGSVREIC